MKSIKYVLILLAVILLSGCTKQQVLLDAYSPPREIKKVEGMISTNSKLGKYLVIAINPEVVIPKNKPNRKTINKYLVSNMQEMLTQTNFFTLDPVYDDANITLDMEVIDYSFKEESNTVSVEMSVDFIITKNSVKYYNKVYTQKRLFQSKAGRQALPSTNTILADLTKNLCESFADDITPLKTRKLVELKSLPDAIAYTINYAMGGNYQGAINAMERYQGTKDMDYFFNLAIYYEGLAAKSESFDLLEKANENYEQAMAMGGVSDALILKEKTKFDNFYDLIKLIKNQKENNKSKIKDLNFKNDIKEKYE